MKHSSRLAVLLLCCLMAACGGPGKSTTGKGTPYFPSLIAQMKFGQPLSEVQRLYPAISENKGEFDFRRTFVLLFEEQDINAVILYFDNEAAIPLYEVILQYQNTALRDQAARQLLGEPNKKDNLGLMNEWQFPSGKGYDIVAWKFKQKLVIAAKLPGCEWDPAEN